MVLTALKAFWIISIDATTGIAAITVKGSLAGLTGTRVLKATGEFQ